MALYDQLPIRSIIYAGDFKALADKYDLLIRQNDGQFIGGSAECARLPQALTDVGWTGRWHRGPRVMDLDYLVPGTVIANFRFVNGQWKYPNERGFHAALFDKFWKGATMTNGLPCEYSVFDQYPAKPAGRRGLSILPEWFKKKNPQMYVDSNRADAFYVVLIP
jgi:hypothetical protein